MGSPGSAAALGGVVLRLSPAYIAAAYDTGATLVRLATASHGHDARAADPWVDKYKPASGRPRTTRTRPA
ncbi:hypothetical protein [Streptomyces sp. NPDC020298]|uniref:hypothetical protein n=1 Tax=unclassified Streptomyces TaxID=2593676 RepID=UPI00340EA33B